MFNNIPQRRQSASARGNVIRAFLRRPFHRSRASPTTTGNHRPAQDYQNALIEPPPTSQMIMFAPSQVFTSFEYEPVSTLAFDQPHFHANDPANFESSFMPAFQPTQASYTAGQQEYFNRPDVGSGQALGSLTPFSGPAPTQFGSASHPTSFATDTRTRPNYVEDDCLLKNTRQFLEEFKHENPWFEVPDLNNHPFLDPEASVEQNCGRHEDALGLIFQDDASLRQHWRAPDRNLPWPWNLPFDKRRFLNTGSAPVPSQDDEDATHTVDNGCLTCEKYRCNCLLPLVDGKCSSCLTPGHRRACYWPEYHYFLGHYETRKAFQPNAIYYNKVRPAPSSPEDILATTVLRKKQKLSQSSSVIGEDRGTELPLRVAVDALGYDYEEEPEYYDDPALEAAARAALAKEARIVRAQMHLRPRDEGFHDDLARRLRQQVTWVYHLDEPRLCRAMMTMIQDRDYI